MNKIIVLLFTLNIFHFNCYAQKDTINNIGTLTFNIGVLLGEFNSTDINNYISNRSRINGWDNSYINGNLGFNMSVNYLIKDKYEIGFLGEYTDAMTWINSKEENEWGGALDQEVFHYSQYNIGLNLNYHHHFFKFLFCNVGFAIIKHEVQFNYSHRSDPLDLGRGDFKIYHGTGLGYRPQIGITLLHNMRISPKFCLFYDYLVIHQNSLDIGYHGLNCNISFAYNFKIKKGVSKVKDGH